MGSYVLNFSVYTMAMVGIIFCALFVFKKFSIGGVFQKKSSMLAIEDHLSINSRKSLLVVKAGGERFLVASDLDRTSLIAPLSSSISANNVERIDAERIPNRIDLGLVNKTADFMNKGSQNSSVIKELAKKMKG
jgi:flagellar biogenesis protein FliO